MLNKMAKQFTLGKNERLKSRKQIEKLFNEGKSFSVSPYRISYLFESFTTGHSPFPVQIGVGVSGKNFKKAVDRNKIKRLTKEAYRLQKIDPIAIGLQKKLEGKNLQLNVFFIYTAKEIPVFNTVKEKVKLILNRLIKLVDENDSSNS